MQNNRIRYEVAMASAKELVANIEEVFAKCDKTIHCGRNEIRELEYEGRQVLIKRYGRPNIFSRVYYSISNNSKARRAMLNATKLTEMGIETARAVGYADVWRGWLYEYSYAITEKAEGKSLRELKPVDEPTTRAYAKFVALLHKKGVAHRDLNPSNVIVRREGEELHFAVIDVNRMKTYGAGEAPEKYRHHDIMCAPYEDNEMFAVFAEEYLRAMGTLSDERLRELIEDKRKDRQVQIRRDNRRWKNKVKEWWYGRKVD